MLRMTLAALRFLENSVWFISPLDKRVRVEAKAFAALKFYQEHYDLLHFRGLGGANKQVILGSKPHNCRFCGGERPAKTFRKRAHAISELLGNKVLKSL